MGWDQVVTNFREFLRSARLLEFLRESVAAGVLLLDPYITATETSILIPLSWTMHISNDLS